MLGDRRVAQGVVGRVVALREDGLYVLVTGICVLLYARDELLPSRPGQVRFAEQRAADWNGVRPCVVLEAMAALTARGDSRFRLNGPDFAPAKLRAKRAYGMSRDKR